MGILDEIMLEELNAHEFTPLVDILVLTLVAPSGVFFFQGVSTWYLRNDYLLSK